MTLCMRAQLYAMMGQTLLAIVIVDNCLIGRNYLDRAKALAVKQTKLRTDQILVSATHTHTTPPGKDRLRTSTTPNIALIFSSSLRVLQKPSRERKKT